VLDKLQPHKYLKGKIQNFGGDLFPFWLQNDSFSQLVVLELLGKVIAQLSPL